MRIAIDLMGGDQAPQDLVPGASRCLLEFPDLEFTLIGDASLIEPAIDSEVQATKRLKVINARQVVAMSDKPSVALRQKRESSMFVAIEQVGSGDAEACVSTGNTGALMAIGRHILKTVEGIDRPAIIKAIPSVKGRCYLLDLGANINCEAENLVQFAAMGSLMCGAVEGIAQPRVGLLNIGAEEVKGEDNIRAAAELLKTMKHINYIGFVEGDGIYQSDADVLVCDGWVGNVALKTSEGLAKFVSYMIEKAFKQNLATKAAAVMSDPVLRKLRSDLSPENYNGATLLGLDGIVVKSHGRSTATGFYHAICEARRSVSQQIPALLRSRVAEVLG